MLFHHAVPFNIDKHTGALTTKISLDHEMEDVYEFAVHVRDTGQPTHTATATMRVEVENVNDHAPAFQADWYEGFVTEDNTKPMVGQKVSMVRLI